MNDLDQGVIKPIAAGHSLLGELGWNPDLVALLQLKQKQFFRQSNFVKHTKQQLLPFAHFHVDYHFEAVVYFKLFVFHDFVLGIVMYGVVHSVECGHFHHPPTAENVADVCFLKRDRSRSRDLASAKLF